MAPSHEQEDHPQPPAHAEQPPEPSHNGNTTASNHSSDGKTAHEHPLTTTPQPAATPPPNEPTPEERTSLFPSDDDTASAASIPSDEGGTPTTTGGVVSPSASIPPYWSSARAAEQHLQAHPHSHGHNHSHNHHALGGGGHARAASSASAESVLPPGAITLQDNEEGEDDDDNGEGGDNGARGNGNGEYAGRRSNSSELSSGRERNRACWARSVQVTDHVLVNGGAMSVGAFVVWNIRVEALNGSRMNIRKRYSEFDDLRRRLVQTFPGFEAAVPALPPKSVLKRFHPRFLEKRRAGLQYFLNCILLNPEFSGSPVLKEFLFS